MFLIPSQIIYVLKWFRQVGSKNIWKDILRLDLIKARKYKI